MPIPPERGRPRRPGRPAAAGPDARGRLLESALAMFADHGFDGATTRDIAARAGVNLGLLQYYFGGKEKLWRSAVDRAFEEFWAALGEAGPGGAAGADLAAIIRAAVRFAARQPALVRLMNDEGKRDGPRLRWLVERHGRRLYDLAVTVLGRAGARRHLHGVAPVHLYYAFIGAAGLIFSQAAECRLLSGTDPATSAATVEAHAELVIRLFLGESSTT